MVLVTKQARDSTCLEGALRAFMQAKLHSSNAVNIRHAPIGRTRLCAQELSCSNLSPVAWQAVRGVRVPRGEHYFLFRNESSKLDARLDLS